jgi:PPIC-type PPIASE domain
MGKLPVLLLFALVMAACGGKQESGPETAAARVNSAYLDREELTGIVPAGLSKQDSIAIIKAYIDRWATQRLLYDAALVNIGDEKQKELERLIEQYKTDLYTKAYLEEKVKQSVDTMVTDAEIEAYYKANKANFRTPETLVKLRYIRIEKGHPKFSAVSQKFTGGGKKNMKALTDMALQFKSYAFNDSVWTSMNDVYQKLPFITPENRDKYISGGISYQYPDSTSVYLVKVAQVTGPSQPAPYDYIKPTIKQLIINNRKLELIKKFQKEIIDDATKDKKYEVFK